MVICPTRGTSILDKFYCNVRNGYRAYQKPKLGNSDHNMVFMALIYRQKIKSEFHKKISVQKWQSEHIMNLQGFECTDWDVLYDESVDININLDVFNSYIRFCTDMLVPTKEIIIYPNNKLD